MRPQNDTGATEQPQYGLQLMDDRPPGSSEERRVDAEIAETPGSGRCWQCSSWPCSSRAQQGECGARTLARVSPWGTGREPAGGVPAAVGSGRGAERAPSSHPAQSSGTS